MLTKLVQKSKILPIKLVGLAVLVSFGFGVISGLDNGVQASVSGRGHSIVQNRYPNIRDDDKCYSSASALTTALNDTGLNDILGIVANYKIKAGLVNSIVRLPIYDWDYDETSTLVNEYAMRGNGSIGKNYITAPHAIVGFDGPSKVKAAKPVGYAKDFDFDLTPVPSYAWLKAIAADPQSLVTLNGRNANPLFYQQATIIGSNGLPKFRLPGLTNNVYNKSYIKDRQLPNGLVKGEVDNIENNAKRHENYEDYIKNPENVAKSLPSIVNEVLKRTNVERHGLNFWQSYPPEKKYIYLLMPELAKQSINEAASQRRSEGENDTKIFIEDRRHTVRVALSKINEIVKRQKPEYLKNNTTLNGWNNDKIFAYVNDENKYNELEQKVFSPDYIDNITGGDRKKLLDVITGSQGINRDLNNAVAAEKFDTKHGNLRDGLSQFEKQRGLMPGVNSNPTSAARAVVQVENAVAGLMGGIFGITGKERFQVRGDRVEDTCYEYMLAPDSAGRVPSYAFSVIDNGFYVTIPGMLYSIQTMIAGKGGSMDGVSIYLKGSANGKASIDCYGRGRTWTLYLDDRYKMGNNVQNISSIFKAILSLIGMSDPVHREVALWQTIGTAIEAALGNFTLLDNVPVPLSREINYHNGMFNLYQAVRDSIRLPGHLADREIDWSRSKLNWMDGITDGRFMATEPSDNFKSTNAVTYMPNLYLVLKKPHSLRPNITPKNNTPDGHTGVVEVSVDKGGYNYSGGKYKSGGSNSGPIRDSKVRLIETVIKPGHYAGEVRDNHFEQSKGNLKHTDGNEVNGLTKGEVCRFYSDKLGDGMEGCNDGENDEVTLVSGNLASDAKPGLYSINTADEAVGKIAIGTVNRHIPSETPPGTKFCYSLYIERKDNDIKYKDERYYRTSRDSNYNPEYHADREKRFLSRAYCIISGYKPSVQVRGGDAIINGNVDTDTNRKNQLETDSDRTYGSWSEYGLLVQGSVSGGNMASGALYRVGYKPTGSFDYDPHGYLTFSNAYKHSAGGQTPDYGNFKSDQIGNGVARLQAFFSLREPMAAPQGTNACISDRTIKLKDCPSGDYRLNDGVNYTVDGTDFNKDENKKKSLVFFVGKNSRITISNNIELPESYDSVADLSQVVFVPRQENQAYKVDIKSDTTRVDAWILNPHGEINTCRYDNPEFTSQDKPRSYVKTKEDGGEKHPCYTNHLTVNGPVAVNKIYLRRSGGVDQNQNPPHNLQQSISGETFNLRPDAYLWALNQVSDSGRKFTTTTLIDLPPRY